MASGSNNLLSYKASQIIGNNTAQNPAGALLQSGAGRADNSTTGDTWIFLDTIGGTTSPWGIKHKQLVNQIAFIGSSAEGAWITMNTGNAYFMGKMGIGYDPETTNNTYKLYVNGTSNFTGRIYGTTGNGLEIQSNNTGGWKEGIRVYNASNNYSVVCLCNSDLSDLLSLVHNGSSHAYYFDIKNNGTYSAINIPSGHNGTMALTDGHGASGTWGISITGTATKLSNTPNNTTTFLRGDNTWSSTLTGRLYLTTIAQGNNDHTGQLSIESASTVTGGNYFSSIAAMAPNVGNSQHLFLVGTARSSKNSAYYGFHYSGTSGSDDNYATIGLYGVDQVINLRANGCVGIGTTTPTYKLQVNGTSYFSNTITGDILSAWHLLAGRPSNTTVFTTHFETAANLHHDNPARTDSEITYNRWFASHGDQTTYGPTALQLPVVDQHILSFGIDNGVAYSRHISFDIRSNAVYVRARTNGTWGNWEQLVRNTGTWGISITGNAATATNARYVVGDNNAASPGGALLHSGSGRADASPGGDTWIYYDTLGGTSTPWGIRHDQGPNTISLIGGGVLSMFAHLQNGILTLGGKFDHASIKKCDTNDRPGLAIFGNYPQIVIMSGAINNTSHGPTLTFSAFDTANATTGNFKSFTFGTPGTNATFLDLGYNANQTNPHANGINNYGTGAVRIMRWNNNGIVEHWGRIDVNCAATDSVGAIRVLDTRTDAGWHYPLLGTCANLPVGGNMYICIGRSASTGYAAGLRYNYQGASSNSNLMGFEFYGQGTKLWCYANGNGGVSGTWDCGNITISHATSADMAYNSANPKITFAESGTQPVTLIYTDYDSYRAPAGLKVCGNQGSEWFEVAGAIYLGGGIQIPTNGGASATSHWISAGGGYSTGSGKSGVKLICCEQSDCVSGLGQDCGGGPYELSIITGQNPGSATQAYTRFLRHSTTSTSYTQLAQLDGNGYFTCSRVYNAVWNDFAEFRAAECEEPGRVVAATKYNNKMTKTTSRLQPAAHVISDTYGCSVGQADDANAPIGVAGRVLVYPYRNRDEYNIGDALCAAPNGTADIMTREEIIMYPDRIIGIVDEIPEYDIWEQTYTVNKSLEDGGKHTSSVQVNGRIWIYVK